jgi:hypothetical protein
MGRTPMSASLHKKCVLCLIICYPCRMARMVMATGITARDTGNGWVLDVNLSARVLFYPRLRCEPLCTTMLLHEKTYVTIGFEHETLLQVIEQVALPLHRLPDVIYYFQLSRLY